MFEQAWLFDSATPVVVAPPRPPEPMLASAMMTRVTGRAFDQQFAHGWALEEKLDGHRAIVVIAGRTVSAFSRPRASEPAKPRTLRPAIVEALRSLSPGIYDGELVAPGGRSWNVVEIGAATVLVLFDIVERRGVSLVSRPYHERRRLLLEELRRLPRSQSAVSTVESLTPTWARVSAIWKRDGEGAIVKRLDSRYSPGRRSPDWIKVKQSRSATLTLVGFEAGKSGPYSAMLLRDARGLLTTVKTLGHHWLRLFTSDPDRYVGRQVVITYQERTPSGTFRHGMFDHFVEAI